jgi:hypothetical protein
MQVAIANRICHPLPSSPFSPHNAQGFDDPHNVQQPNFPNDRNAQGSTPSPRFRGSILESFSNGLEHIPVAVDRSVLAAGGKTQHVLVVAGGGI